MSQFQKNRFYFGNTVVFTLLVLLSLGAQAKPSDEVIVKSISEQEQRAALNYWTDERIEKHWHKIMTISCTNRIGLIPPEVPR
ncbi:hypothetical protein [Xylella fastidiosa]|uniref:hypothetical protein n=1 Tax=Xylella fastidiosa TaxID=2371 RepID=UPI0034DDFAF8